MKCVLAGARFAVALALAAQPAMAGPAEGNNIASRPAPTQGSMPTGGAAPAGKMGTPPTARGKLGSETHPGERKPPPGAERSPSSQPAPK